MQEENAGKDARDWFECAENGRALRADQKCSLLEEHDCTDAEGEGKEDCYAPTAHCLRQAELMRDQAEGQRTDRTDERHVKAQAEARDLTVAEMPEKQDIDGIGHTGR